MPRSTNRNSRSALQKGPSGWGGQFRDKVTDTTADRPQLRRLIAALQPGNVVITPAVDRLSRDTTDLLVVARELGPGVQVARANSGFDPLSVLEKWVEEGVPPDSILMTNEQSNGLPSGRRRGGQHDAFDLDLLELCRSEVLSKRRFIVVSRIYQ